MNPDIARDFMHQLTDIKVSEKVDSVWCNLSSEFCGADYPYKKALDAKNMRLATFDCSRFETK